jgi:hypothetical protein
VVEGHAEAEAKGDGGDHHGDEGEDRPQGSAAHRPAENMVAPS